MDTTTEVPPGLHRAQIVWLWFVALVPWVTVTLTWTLRPDLYAGAFSKSGFVVFGGSAVAACVIAGVNAVLQWLAFRAINGGSVREHWLLFSALVGIPAFLVFDSTSFLMVIFAPIIFQFIHGGV